MNHRKILIALVALFAAVVVIKVGSPVLLNNFLSKKMQSHCPRCAFSMKNPNILYLESEVIVHDLHYKSDPADVTTVELKIPRAVIAFKAGTIMKGPPVITRLGFDELFISVADDDLKKPSDKPIDYQWITKLPAISVEETKIINSHFEYVLHTHQQKAILSVYEINGDISHIGTRPEISPRFGNFKIRALLEHSGKVDMSGTVDLFGKTNHDRINISLTQQKLPELNPFFSIEDGIDLEGFLFKSNASMKLTSGHLSGTLTAIYKDLKVHYKKTPERGSLKSSLSNFLSAATIAKARVKTPQSEPSTEILRERKTNEGLIKFLLGGLKDAALKILTRKD